MGGDRRVRVSAERRHRDGRLRHGDDRHAPHRTGGAGLLGVALAATLWYSGAPWPAAVLGTFTYRFFALWPPQPLSFLLLPRLRRLLESSGDSDAPTSAEADAGERTDEPALQR